jgi:DNA repair protein RadC
LQDHIITSGNNYFSFKQEGLLWLTLKIN